MFANLIHIMKNSKLRISHPDVETVAVLPSVTRRSHHDGVVTRADQPGDRYHDRCMRIRQPRLVEHWKNDTYVPVIIETINNIGALIAKL